MALIPKLIHQTAKTADLSDESRRYQQIVRDLHPDWTYKLWTDADNDAFVRSEFPGFYDTFVGLPKNIMRADVIRYLLMDRLGGLYLDLDYEMTRPFDLLEYECVVPLENDRDAAGRTVLGNAIFAAAPGNLFFRRVIDVLANRPPLKADADVLSTTGPAFITEVYHSMSADERAHVYAAPRKLFHPPTPRNNREYQTIAKDATVYGMHHCEGTWRDFTPMQKLRRWMGDVYHKIR